MREKNPPPFCWARTGYIFHLLEKFILLKGRQFSELRFDTGSTWDASVLPRMQCDTDATSIGTPALMWAGFPYAHVHIVGRPRSIDIEIIRKQFAKLA